MVSRGGNGHKVVDFSLLPLGKAKLLAAVVPFVRPLFCLAVIQVP